MVPFTFREMKRAWRQNRKAGTVVSANNSHRLLLFYATECGLKALILKRKRLDSTIGCKQIQSAGHNLNKLLDDLRAGADLKIKKELSLSPINSGKLTRNCGVGDLNQIWRYGGKCQNISDKEIQKSLELINQWLEEQL